MICILRPGSSEFKEKIIKTDQTELTLAPSAQEHLFIGYTGPLSWRRVKSASNLYLFFYSTINCWSPHNLFSLSSELVAGRSSLYFLEGRKHMRRNLLRFFKKSLKQYLKRC